MDFVPRGQSRVVLFAELVLRTAVFVSLQLARGPRAVFDFATRMSERMIRKRKLEFHQDKIPEKKTLSQMTGIIDNQKRL